MHLRNTQLQSKEAAGSFVANPVENSVVTMAISASVHPGELGWVRYFLTNSTTTSPLVTACDFSAASTEANAESMA